MINVYKSNPKRMINFVNNHQIFSKTKLEFARLKGISRIKKEI